VKRQQKGHARKSLRMQTASHQPWLEESRYLKAQTRRPLVSREQVKQKTGKRLRSPGMEAALTCFSSLLLALNHGMWWYFNLSAYRLHMTTQPMQPFFFGSSSSSLSKSGTRGVGLCGVVMSFSDEEFFCGAGRDAITGVIR
jgi:hypothetical protein